jgi:tetratricopeptide (TPR) repeat protein
MFLIGTPLLRLKFLLHIFVTFCFFVSLASESRALDRPLTPEEIEKLKKNISIDPLNLTSRRFLMDHFAKEKNWQELVTIAHPVQKDLPAADQILLTKTYIQLKDAKSAGAVIGFYQSKFGPSAESKLLEAEILTLFAEKDPVEQSRKQKAIEIIAVLREGIQLDPKNKDSYLAWVKTLETFWSSYAEDALQVYHLLETATKDPISYLNPKCDLLVKASLWDQALEVCKKAVKQEAADIQSYVNLAKAQSIKKSLAESKVTLQNLVLRFPNSAAAHKALAFDYFSENNFISSAEHYKRATELDPNDSESFLFLAQSEFRQKKYLEALEAYRQNCRLSRTLASEFKHSAGELRNNYPLHNKFKNAMSSCQK